MPKFTIDAERVQNVVISVEAASREALTDEAVSAALDRLPDSAWRTDNYGVIVKPETSSPTIQQRADEIGVSLATIHRWRREGVASMMLCRSSAKPMSSMRSASSSTMTSTAPRGSAPLWTSSRIRPGVPTTMCGS